jgi:hypothetical protein
MDKITDWATRIRDSAGSSASIEYINKSSSVGGFTCNLGRALASLFGFNRNVNLIGSFGLPEAQPIFQEDLKNKCQCSLFSVGKPGLIKIFEFSDGKIKMGNFENINQLDWNQIVSSVGRDFLVEQFNAGRLWGFGYWASSPHMSDIFRGFQTSILPNLSRSSKDKFLIIDLSDIRKKPKAQLTELYSILTRFEEFVQVILLLNDHELHALGDAINEENSLTPLALTYNIYQKLNISSVIAHGPKIATMVFRGKESQVLNAYTPSPKFMTSAGDHFNAGIAYALLAKFPIETLLLFGNGTSSYFVRKGTSPSSRDLQNFLSNYREYLDQDGKM